VKLDERCWGQLNDVTVGKDVRYLLEAENVEELDKHKLGCNG
jgi:hypothetical protein